MFQMCKQNNSPDKCFHKSSECHICKKRDILAQNAPRKERELLPRKTAIPNKSKSKKKSKDAKFKKKKRNSKIKFVDTQEEVSSDSEVSSDGGGNFQSDCLCLPYRTSQREKPMQFWYH